ncbi:MAG: pentapeptide repeat-containing protein [Desulfobacter sp.]|nr:MAG: pentapeptide repeat-containing protein [Desulfobacter sp.]
MTDIYKLGANELKITKPISVWKREIDIPREQLFAGLGKIGLKGISFDWAGVGEAAIETINGSGFAKKPGEIAFLLIYKSLISTIFNLAKEYEDLYDGKFDSSTFEKVSEKFEIEFEKIEITIDRSFFNRPGESEFLNKIRPLLKKWFIDFGVKQNDAHLISNRFNDFFVFALNDEWNNDQRYQSLLDFYSTPFIKATDESRGWQLYNQWLKKQIKDRMFAEHFGLEQIYIPLRGYHESKVDGDILTEKIVFDLETDFNEWVKNFSKKSCIRFLSGGPGSGKSSFAKIFAYRIANTTDITTVYIPLHIFDINVTLIDGMEKFVKYNRFIHQNPLDPKIGKKRLLIIFDGLDEIALQGKAAQDRANSFVEEILLRIPDGNKQGFKHQVLITGRPIAIQSIYNQLTQEKQITHILPYYFERKDHHAGPLKLLKLDQRALWWKNYGRLTKKNFTSVPDEISEISIDEVTAQPLLNYLVALTYISGQVTFSKDTNLNEIYRGLIKEVYERQYESGRKTVGELKENQFVRVLEEIALTMWKNGERRAHISNILEHCDNKKVKKHIQIFKEGAKAGITRLLTAFYFRQSDYKIHGNDTFEFTHKSFSEYLVSKRLCRFLRDVQYEFDLCDDDPTRKFEIEGILKKWLSFYSQTTLDSDILKYLKNEFKLIEVGNLIKYQKSISKLISYVINHGLPIIAMSEDLHFNDLIKLFKNSGEALLAVHFTLASITKKISDFEIISSSAFGNWMNLLRTQRAESKNTIGFQSLGYIDLQNQNIAFQDFYGAMLSHTNLERTNLMEANMVEAILTEANLKKANLTRVKMDRANLSKTDLSQASLNKASLMEASLPDAILKKADLRKANLRYANLVRADLSMANLEEANLEGAILIGANLTDTNFSEANLRGASMDAANALGANMAGAKR